MEWIAISFISLEVRYTDDILLRVAQAMTSKGYDQADFSLNLLGYYDIVNKIS